LKNALLSNKFVTERVSIKWCHLPGWISY